MLAGLLVQGCGSAITTQAVSVLTATAGEELEAQLGAFSDSVRQATTLVKPAVVQITNQQLVSGTGNQRFTVPARLTSGQRRPAGQ